MLARVVVCCTHLTMWPCSDQCELVVFCGVYFASAMYACVLARVVACSCDNYISRWCVFVCACVRVCGSLECVCVCDCKGERFYRIVSI